MNKLNSSLPFYNSTSSLTSRLEDTLFTILLPMTSSIGVVFFKMTSINVIWTILKKPDPHFIYYYMLAFELSDTMCATIVCFVAMFKCGQLCSLSYDYITNLFNLIFYAYGLNVFIQFQTFLEISLAYERLNIFSSKQSKYNVSRFKTKLVVFFALAVVVSLPNHLITQSIRPFGVLIEENNREKVLYEVTLSAFAQNIYWAIGLFFFGFLKGFLMYIVLFVINVKIIYKFRKIRAKKLNALKNVAPLDDFNQQPPPPSPPPASSDTKSHLTRTVLAMNFNFLLCNVPISIAPILFYLMNKTEFYSYYTVFINVNSVVTHSLYLVLYYMCNPVFKKTFLQIYSNSE